MQPAFYLVRIGEIALKKRNRKRFLQALQAGIALRTRDLHLEILPQHKKLLLRCAAPAELLRRRLASAFGIAGISPLWTCSHRLEDIQQLCWQLVQPHRGSARSFAVRARRIRKNLPFGSMDVERQVGADLLARGLGMQVNLKHPELEIQISLEYQNSWISLETWPGPGGLPQLGDSRHLLLLSGGIDSPLAGNLIQKRGGTLAAVHFHTPPYTVEAAREKAHDLAALLARFQGELTLFQIPITRFMKRVLADCQQRYAVVLSRRFMVALAGELARRHGIHSLVTGESLAQVASQTIQNMAVIEQGCELPILRPLIGFDKLEIVARAISLGSFPISTRPEQDCCSLFAPAEPVTKASLSLVQAMEAVLPMAELMEDALAEVETCHLVCDYAREIRP